MPLARTPLIRQRNLSGAPQGGSAGELPPATTHLSIDYQSSPLTSAAVPLRPVRGLRSPAAFYPLLPWSGMFYVSTDAKSAKAKPPKDEGPVEGIHACATGL